jgi:hypothetical protein
LLGRVSREERSRRVDSNEGCWDAIAMIGVCNASIRPIRNLAQEPFQLGNAHGALRVLIFREHRTVSPRSEQVCSQRFHSDTLSR